jgi:hypothetical protein
MGDLVKIQFYERDVGYENLWAEPLPDGLYKIMNVPFYVYGVSVGDFVSASPDSDGRLHFSQVVAPSGATTLRALTGKVTIEYQQVQTMIKMLESLGCQIEVRKPNMIAISVPAAVRLGSVTDFLSSEDLRWEYANPTSE